ncbi:MAG: hypothetical protein IJ050_09555, partial [Clostridia bacterium]|nr:hypothetical protein [Clostridia bacterium]
VRKIFLPRTVALLLKERKKLLDSYIQYLGDDYMDFNLVICYENGTPMEKGKIRSINTINVAGKVGRIICVFLVIAVITCMVITGILTAGVIRISNQDITVRVSREIDIESSGNFLDMLNSFIKIDGVDNLSDLVPEDGQVITAGKEGKDITIDDSDFSEINVTRKGNALTVNTKAHETVFSVKRVIVNLVVTFVMLGTAAFAIHTVKWLMKALEICETPFCENVIKKMTLFANSLIPVIIMNTLCNAVWNSLGKGSELNISLNIGSVLLVAVVYLLIAVFRYGAQLQQEADETL